MKSVTRNVFFVLLVLTGITMFFGIGSLPLRSPYEAAFGEVAREMAEAGNFLSPRLFDKFALGLAPLSYILSALSIDVFGATEFAVRLPAALGAILLTMAVYITTTHTFNERSGFWAGMAFGTAMLTFFLVKTAVPFSGLLFFVSLALLCFIRRHYWAMYVFLALCVLTDGPWALVFPVLIILAYLILTGQIYVLGRMHLLRGIVLFLVLCAPWVGTKFYLQGMPFLTEFFQFRDFGLVSLAAPDSGNPLWFYVPVLLAGMFPWTGLMLKSLKDSICESRTSDLEILLFYQIWWFITFLLFTICSRQFATSIVLTFPPLAVMIGWNLDRMRKENGRNHAGWAVLSILTFAVAAVAWVWVLRPLPQLTFGSFVMAGITVLFGIAIAIALLLYKDAALGEWLHAAAAILTMVVVYSFFLPVVPGTFTERSVAEEFRTRSAGQAVTLYMLPEHRPALAFYSGNPGLVLNPADAQSVASFRADEGSKYIVLPQTVFDRYAGVLGGTEWQKEAEKDGLVLYSRIVREQPAPVVTKKEPAAAAPDKKAAPAGREQNPETAVTEQKAAPAVTKKSAAPAAPAKKPVREKSKKTS
ncbi:MAG: glycosyltransferase family 39 protein [Succiniclasticum sp.]|jgi:4-amino-4-deoxy-L-arabinose transferase-like glycosyltransferase|nr:glycosyltransferase family 39 protein [Succiniclasticum sp.]MEE3479641.1 glycosyltransferase family 39 protein [Succiniclasticum sp.]